MEQAGRTGTYEPQPGNYRAFIPKALPFESPIRYDDRLMTTLSKADRAIGKLNAAAGMLPNPDLFVAMYVKKESVLSSRVEGVTQASLGEVLEHEARSRTRLRPDVKEVLNHVNATNYGMERLNSLPLSNRLIREIHERLMTSVRGGDKASGQFRAEQNWIGAPDCDIYSATFVPPPPDAMNQAMVALEAYFHERAPTPPLVKAGLIHYQFETIHPFLDGNGRLGRLLVTFFLFEQKILARPLLYISQFIEQYKDEYYNRLQGARDTGDIEVWLEFFLTAVWRVAEAASETAANILQLRERHRTLIHESASSSGNALLLLDHLFAVPVITINDAKKALEVSYPTASSIVKQMASFGLLEEITAQNRNRVYAYAPYLDLMDAGLASKPSGDEGDNRASKLATVS